MKKSFLENTAFQFLVLFLVIFLSRLPFLFAGFGVEEDSWLLAITAKNIAESGRYEMSRAPAHPAQEFLYALIYDNGLLPFTTNLISALCSAIATLFFALTLKSLGFKHYLFAAFAFAFTPVVYISSTYTIDYMLAMAFVMGSFYFLIRFLQREGRPQAFPFAWTDLTWAGLFLGIAIGFRITSAAMVVPFCILFFPLSKNKLMKICFFVCISILVGVFMYVPVFKTYGFSFFTYSDQFPYPNFMKIFYKATFGVFGLIGMLVILFCVIKIILQKCPAGSVKEKTGKWLLISCVAVVILYIISYLRLPQKSAYFIPIVPFVILAMGYFLSNYAFKLFSVFITLSSFFFSINLTDPFRGSTHSPASIKFLIAGQEIFLDPLTGPVFSDYTKRLNKTVFTEKVLKKTVLEQKKIVLICGWWYNELLVRSWKLKQNQNVAFVFYIDKTTMDKYISEGYRIFYLPEQNSYNDQYSHMNYTDSVAQPYPFSEK